jgi:hypothetical protein
VRPASMLLPMLLTFLAFADAGTGTGGTHPRLGRGPTRPPGGHHVAHQRPGTGVSALTSQANWVAAYAIACARSHEPSWEHVLAATSIADRRIDVIATALSRLETLGDIDRVTKQVARSLLLQAWAELSDQSEAGN